MACIPIDFGCIAGSAANTMVGGMFDQLAKSILEGVGVAFGALGTAWMMVPSPEVGAGGGPQIKSKPRPVTAEMLGMETLLGWLKWAGLVIVAVSLIVAFINVMVRSHRGEPMFGGSRILTLCGAAGMIGAAAPLIGALFKHPGRAASTVEFLQANLWWLTMLSAVVGVVFAAIRMAMTHRVDPLRTWMNDLIHLAVWSLLGAAIVSTATTALDSLALQITFAGLDCGEGAQASCFGENLAKMFGVASAFGGGGMFAIIAAVLGFLALMGSLGQIFLLLVRSAIVPLMVGVLPVTAAAATSGSRRAKNAQDQLIGWLVGFVFYKLAAGIVYGTGFFMAGADWMADDGTGILQALSGLVLLVCAVIALPMLMKAVAPSVGAVVGAGAGGGAMGMAAAAIPLGAMGARSLMGVGSKGSGGGGGAVPQSGSGLAGKSTLTGASAAGASGSGAAAAAGGPVGLGVAAAGAAGKKVGEVGAKAAGAMQAAAASSTGQSSGAGSTAPAGATPGGVGGMPTTGPQPTGAGAGAPSPGGAAQPGSPTGGGAAAGGASSTGGAAAGAAKAAGPWGAAAGAAAQAASGAAKAAKGATTSAVQNSTGGGPTPSGSSGNQKG